MILIMENIKRKYKYTVVENMKFISNQLNEHPSDHDIWLKYHKLYRSVFAGSHQNPSHQKDGLHVYQVSYYLQYIRLHSDKA